jgi:hypothetical protein
MNARGGPACPDRHSASMSTNPRPSASPGGTGAERHGLFGASRYSMVERLSGHCSVKSHPFPVSRSALTTGNTPGSHQFGYDRFMLGVVFHSVRRSPRPVHFPSPPTCSAAPARNYTHSPTAAWPIRRPAPPRRSRFCAFFFVRRADPTSARFALPSCRPRVKIVHSGPSTPLSKSHAQNVRPVFRRERAGRRTTGAARRLL